MSPSDPPQAGQHLNFTVAAEVQRLDHFLVERQPGLTRSRLQRLIARGLARVNGRPAKAGTRLKAGDRVALELPPPEPAALAPEARPLTIIYEDAHILVIDKPPGLAVHPGSGLSRGTLAHALLAHCPSLAQVGSSLRPGIVHRLDKDTSGLMVVAKTDAAYHDLVRQFQKRQVAKGYLALVQGRPQPAEGVIAGDLGRDPARRQRMAVVSRGREARTRYKVLEYLDKQSLLEVSPETGRTHQIRVHLAAAGFPIYGDPVYGPRPKDKGAAGLGRQFLHAHRLGFRLPGSGEWREFRSPLPPDLAQALASLAHPGHKVLSSLANL
ncbi:MAG: RluA family pseudouridine synthase [Chloroflexi bacterium]|nr:RluA family pseudouridine synthase [Chloroflexota bacterium]